MNPEQRELYQKIRAFSLDEPGAAFTFTQRLARENGWSSEYARRVVKEYKRFAFLAVAAGHPVSPSDEVDQVWHLHMSYTHSYWGRFTREVLGKPLHHEPARGGLEERKKFERWYQKTLESYQAIFGSEAPADIWPEPRARFSEEVCFERVDRKETIVLSRASLKLTLALVLAAAGLGLLAAFGQELAGALRSAVDMRGTDFLGFYFFTLLGVIVGGLLFRRSLRKPDDEPLAAELVLHPYEAAYLAGGARRSTEAAVASLVERGILKPLPVARQITREAAFQHPSHPLERALIGVTTPGVGTKVSKVQGAAKAAIEGIRSKLVSVGLLISRPREFVGRAVPILVLLATVLLGAVKIFVGLGRHRPVGLLVLLVLVSGIAGLVLFGRRLGRSRRGDRAVSRLQHHYHGLEAKAARVNAGMTSLEVPMAVGLFGLAAFGGGQFGSLKDALKGPSFIDGGSGCGGGGCGGGGCGSGCGGCGGCGG